MWKALKDIPSPTHKIVRTNKKSLNLSTLLLCLSYITQIGRGCSMDQSVQRADHS